MKGTVGCSKVEPNETVEILEEFFGTRIIYKGLWPSRSPD
jgi:hypothetical protein